MRYMCELFVRKYKPTDAIPMTVWELAIIRLDSLTEAGSHSPHHLVYLRTGKRPQHGRYLRLYEDLQPFWRPYREFSTKTVSL